MRKIFDTTVLGAPTISSLTPSTVGPGTKQPVAIAGTGFSQATGVTFSHTGITAVIKTGVTDTNLPLTLQVASTVPPGTYTFTVTTPLGTANSWLHHAHGGRHQWRLCARQIACECLDSEGDGLGGQRRGRPVNQ